MTTSGANASCCGFARMVCAEASSGASPVAAAGPIPARRPSRSGRPPAPPPSPPPTRPRHHPQNTPLPRQLSPSSSVSRPCPDRVIHSRATARAAGPVLALCSEHSHGLAWAQAGAVGTVRRSRRCRDCCDLGRDRGSSLCPENPWQRPKDSGEEGKEALRTSCRTSDREQHAPRGNRRRRRGTSRSNARTARGKEGREGGKNVEMGVESANGLKMPWKSLVGHCRVCCAQPRADTLTGRRERRQETRGKNDWWKTRWGTRRCRVDAGISRVTRPPRLVKSGS